MKTSLYILILWSLFSYGCDPCDECGEPLLYDPLVGVIFINKDSADELSSRITLNTDSSKYYTGLRTDSLAFQDSLSDRLDTVEAYLLDSGWTEYLEERDFLDSSIMAMQPGIDTLSKIISRFTASIKQLNSLLAVVNSGTILLDSAIILSNHQVIINDDSAKKYNLPLLLGQLETTYRLVISGYVDTVTFSYEPFDEVNQARVYRLRAKNIHISEHTFDSLAGPLCVTEECMNNETTFTVYF